MASANLSLQDLCERGQELLSQTDYLAAERVLVEAERIAWEGRNFETLARLYMPLQETRRQKRQLCGEGTIRLDLFEGNLSANYLIDQYPQGQLLVAAEGNIAPAIELRRLAAERQLYLETFLAATYRLGQQHAVIIVGLEESHIPAANQISSIDQLLHQIPPHGLVLTENELMGEENQTYAHTMSLWERLHLPYLAAADAEVDPLRKMAAYRQTIRVDYACELAHQKLADVAAGLGRTSRQNAE